MSERLANPPVIDTDIPSNYSFVTGHAYPDDHGGITDPNRRYSPNGGEVLSLDNVPLGFSAPGYEQGVVLLASAFAPAGNIITNLRRGAGAGTPKDGGSLLLCIAPSAGLLGYRTNWRLCEGILGSNPLGYAYVAINNGAIAAQRMGSRIFVFGGDDRFSATVASVDGTFKITYEQSTAPQTAGNLKGGTYTITDGSQFFVSDDVTPFAWCVEDVGVANTWVSGWSIDKTKALGYRFQDNDGKLHTNEESGAFLQKAPAPEGVVFTGPYLVFPWAVGDYGHPEAWYFVTEYDDQDRTTGEITVYRSRWDKGNYTRVPNLVLDDDPAFNAGTSRFPSRNPYGYAFDPNWHTAANKVTRFNLSTPIWNQRTTFLAQQQNAELTASGRFITEPRFAVQRNLKRPNVLHLTAVDFERLVHKDVADPIDMLWYLTSGNDGQTFSPARKMHPSAASSVSPTSYEHGQGRVSASTFAVTRTREDVTVLGITDSWIYDPGIAGTDPTKVTGYDHYLTGQGPTAGAHAALAVVDYDAIGTVNADVNSVVFKGSVAAGALA